MTLPTHKIQMVDLFSQYQRIKPEVDAAIQQVIDRSAFIKGDEVLRLEAQLSSYCKCRQVISCANGTDALQIALMALELNPEDEIIIPAFTYVATAEVIALLGLTPVMVDVDPFTFNCSVSELEKAITPKTKAIIPVHLFGQAAPMEAIMQLANKYNLWVIEDNAQALGAEVIFQDGIIHKAGTIGHLGCTSFFPTKNLGCFGDGGAIQTNDEALAGKIRMIANHGQKIKYQHSLIGCNSRLDTIQAAILEVKLKQLDQYIQARQKAAGFYTLRLQNCNSIQLPAQSTNTPHTFNQYTLQVNDGKRDELKKYLTEKGIPSIIYYPTPLYRQEAFSKYAPKGFSLKHTEQLCQSVLSIPMHTELTEEIQEYIVEAIIQFDNRVTK